MRKLATIALGLLASASLLAGSAEASTISITATSITSGNFLGYFGLNTLGGGVGNGTYQLGTCSYDLGTNRTNCVTTGTYVETGTSVNPGATGSFTWRQTWVGNIPNPITAQSIAPGSNTLGLGVVPEGSFFEVLLSGGQYANLDFGLVSTPNPQGGQLNWQAFLGPNAVCTGSPVNCSVGQVGLAAGSSISSTISPFNMQLTYPGAPPPNVPEPSTWVLLGTGIAGLVARARLRK